LFEKNLNQIFLAFAKSGIVTTKVFSEKKNNKNALGCGIVKGTYGGTKNIIVLPVIESIHKVRLPGVRSSNRRLECEGSQLARQRLRHRLSHHRVIL
jgi:hypothetical protein